MGTRILVIGIGGEVLHTFLNLLKFCSIWAIEIAGVFIPYWAWLVVPFLSWAHSHIAVEI